MDDAFIDMGGVMQEDTDDLRHAIETARRVSGLADSIPIPPPILHSGSDLLFDGDSQIDLSGMSQARDTAQAFIHDMDADKTLGSFCRSAPSKYESRIKEALSKGSINLAIVEILAEVSQLYSSPDVAAGRVDAWIESIRTDIEYERTHTRW